MTATMLRETGVAHLVEGNAAATLEVLVISPGQGSSGFYSEATLQQAAADRVFPAGLHTYLDHPGTIEERDRPERSLRDLAGRLASDAEWRPDGPDGPGLYATAHVYPSWQPVIAEMADDIGLSIRAYGTADADGNITRLTRAESVDYVTRAGRGGRIVGLLESARATAPPLAEARNAGQWFESRLHLAFTEIADHLAADGHLSRDERIGLSAAIGDALTAFAARLEVDHPQLYRRDPYDQPPTDPDTTAAREGGEQEHRMPEIEQAELDRLREAASNADTTATELATERAAREAAEQRLLVHDAAEHARGLLAESDLPDPARQRVVEAVTAGPIPTGTDGTLDTVALATAVTDATTREAAYITSVGGAGRPRGGNGGNDPTVKAGQVQESVPRTAEDYLALGLPEHTARILATR
jgi:hypothetical protein